VAELCKAIDIRLVRVRRLELRGCHLDVLAFGRCDLGFDVSHVSCLIARTAGYQDAAISSRRAYLGWRHLNRQQVLKDRDMCRNGQYGTVPGFIACLLASLALHATAGTWRCGDIACIVRVGGTPGNKADLALPLEAELCPKELKTRQRSLDADNESAEPELVWRCFRCIVEALRHTDTRSRSKTPIAW
jgi:hypothetical protein